VFTDNVSFPTPHPGVQAVTAPASLTMGRFWRGKQIASYLGLIPTDFGSRPALPTSLHIIREPHEELPGMRIWTRKKDHPLAFLALTRPWLYVIRLNELLQVIEIKAQGVPHLHKWYPALRGPAVERRD
jgi:hypothetical protein